MLFSPISGGQIQWCSEHTCSSGSGAIWSVGMSSAWPHAEQKAYFSLQQEIINFLKLRAFNDIYLQICVSKPNGRDCRNFRNKNFLNTLKVNEHKFNQTYLLLYTDGCCFMKTALPLIYLQ